MSPRVVRDEQKDPANGWSEEILNWQGVPTGHQIKGAEDLEFDRLPWREFEL